MAKRRMFSKEITNSEEFFEMPISTQCLYFHLSMNSDDDGFVQPNRIMRMTGVGKIDDLKVLKSKGFIIPIADKVIVIRHWKVNNTIRKDRHTPSMYKKHLKYLEIDEDNVYNCGGLPDDNQNGNQWYTQVRLGKDRLGKESKDKNICTEPSSVQEEKKSVIFFSCIKDNIYHVHKEDIIEWENTYPAVDIMQELKCMKQWLLSNPTKKKTKKGMRRFITGWLGRKQDKGGNKNSFVAPKTFGQIEAEEMRIFKLGEEERKKRREEKIKQWRLNNGDRKQLSNG